MSTVQVFIVAVLTALVFGFGTGWYVNDKFDKANVVEHLTETRKEDSKNVADAQAKDRAIATEKEKVREEIKVVTKEIVKYVPRYRTAQCPATEQASNGTSQPPVAENKAQLAAATDVLTVGAVRLLNDARTGAADRAAKRSDAEEQAPSDVTLEVFVVNDLEIVQQYRELAKDHDALVEYVEELMRKQRARLGLSQ